MKELDIKTKLFIKMNRLRVEYEKKCTTSGNNTHIIYLFNGFNDYQNYFKKYVGEISPLAINHPIIYTAKNGVIIASKYYCDVLITDILIRQKIKTLSFEDLKELHQLGKISQMEKIDEWESFGLCAPGDGAGSAKERCAFFNHDCHKCLMEYASHSEDYNQMKLSVTNTMPNHKLFLSKKINK